MYFYTYDEVQYLRQNDFLMCNQVIFFFYWRSQGLFLPDILFMYDKDQIVCDLCSGICVWNSRKGMRNLFVHPWSGRVQRQSFMQGSTQVILTSPKRWPRSLSPNLASSAKRREGTVWRVDDTTWKKVACQLYFLCVSWTRDWRCNSLGMCLHAYLHAPKLNVPLLKEY